MKHSRFILFSLFYYTPFIFAQNNDCDAIITFLQKKETQIAQLNLHDPDYIPLHYLVVQDIMKDLKQFKSNIIPNYSECKVITFSELINKFDELYNSVLEKNDSLAWLNNNVYLLFYEKAQYEYQLNNEEDGKYFIDRSLQYNPTFPNSILLKLNKLLDRKYFNECLSLLNTLYYETDMDDEQEKQAIVFTNKFYDKLYKTGDSLLKMEHAAEALELFEVLENFCQNLPTAYCNDDYYHGVLNSKTGIYDSYLAIAKVAEKRGNSQIAARFFQYAQEYLDNNSHLITYKPKETSLITEIIKQNDQSSISVEEKTIVIEEIIFPIEETKTHVEEIIPEMENIIPEPSPAELQEIYDAMVMQALAFCIKEDFSESYKMFLEAKKMEECRCLKTDFRVDLMIKELKKFLD